MNNLKLLYIDLFCGAGGTTTGIEKATIKGNKGGNLWYFQFSTLLYVLILTNGVTGFPSSLISST